MNKPLIGYMSIHSKGIPSLDEKLGNDQPGWIMAREHFLRYTEESGGVPIIVKYSQDTTIMDQIYDMLDGFLIPGGSDVDPSMYGEEPNKEALGSINAERDKLETYMLQKAIEDKKPILGVCRGIQIVNVLEGGTLYQDMKSQLNNEAHTADRYPCFDDSPVVTVHLEKGSRLHTLMGIDEFTTNCAHHQAVKDVAPGYSVAGRADDGIIEAIEKDDPNHWVVLVQPHPEAQLAKRPIFRKVWEEFVHQCAHYRSSH